MAKTNRDKKQAKAERKEERRKILNTVGMAVMLILLGLTIYAVVFRGAQRPSAARTQAIDRAHSMDGRSQTECPTRAADPWEYDEATDCHYDPGHGHWHLGRPPSPRDRGASPLPAPAATPPPAAAPAPPPEAAPFVPEGAEQE